MPAYTITTTQNIDELTASAEQTPAKKEKSAISKFLTS